MADKNIKKANNAERRRKRVRGKVMGTPEIPRLTVCKTLKNVFAQVIDDVNHVTLVSAATNSKDVKAKIKDDMSKTEASHLAGEVLAELAKAKGIEKVVFDRNKSPYHGRVKAIAEGARKGGLKF